MSFPIIIISSHAQRQLEQGEIWFGQRAVRGTPLKTPGIVQLVTETQGFLGYAFFSPTSEQYCLRLVSRGDTEPNQAFWQQRFKQALKRRERLTAITNSYRVINAEADGFPGLVLDKYDQIWVVQITTEGARVILPLLVEGIVKECKPVSIIERPSPHAAGAEESSGPRFLFGSESVASIQEDTQRFELNVLEGQKTGAYLDYRVFRLKVRELAQGKCLDGCCYHGWLSCHLAGVAQHITAIDSSEPALAAARKNLSINSHTNVELVKANIFDFLKNTTEEYDFVHIDPPSFAKGHSELAQAIKGYEKLTTLTLARLKKPGTFFISACAHAVSARILEETVLAAIQKAGLAGHVIYRGQQDKDHPTLRGHSPSLYLKAIAINVDSLSV